MTSSFYIPGARAEATCVHLQAITNRTGVMPEKVLICGYYPYDVP